MSIDVRRGAVWAAVFFTLWVPGHLLLMPWLANRYPIFEQWNYGTEETWIMGAAISLMGGVIFAFWKPKH